MDLFFHFTGEKLLFLYNNYEKCTANLDAWKCFHSATLSDDCLLTLRSDCVPSNQQVLKWETGRENAQQKQNPAHC